MATTFEVYSGLDDPPSFASVATIAHARLMDFAKRPGLGLVPQIRYELHEQNGAKSPIAPEDPMLWARGAYVWFQLGETVGGTDAYYSRMNDADASAWEEEIASRHETRRLSDLIRRCLCTRHRWWFRRSAGQPSIVNLGYGFLAAALAEATQGFVYSEDGAWEYNRFPCEPTEFYEFYYRPEMANEIAFKEWSERNIEMLRKNGMQA